MSITNSQDSSITRRGSCLCEAIKFEVAGPPSVSLICYCKHCRKASSSVGHYMSVWNQNNFKLIEGDNSLKKFRSYDTESGNPKDRFFCSTCGSTIYAITTSFASDAYYVRTALLDGPLTKELYPTLEYYTEQKPEFFKLV
ncbi:hypothetical protein PACTADRAFT_4395 [Pachysolen tannophilus NRRL Y-2460]|uniref:CENP-V/GFA domain-containing protein n=1 Tax=Pachysolen tannophilus NRRL Y-2460 TaxID=669874 RepID=A0A1E4TRR6_PACTA|nr:hypothetical protein PACTADRAFT_4395 [Pachysolen tannophilus NRRL Y-2460]